MRHENAQSDNADFKGRNPGLDFMRVVAIGLVLLLHSAELGSSTPIIYKKIASIGWAGVDLFFVLSGYLLFNQARIINSLGNIRTFWIKRFFRTLPLYYVVLFVYWILKPIVFKAHFNVENPWRFLIFIQNYYYIFDFSQSWSLCIEEQFYFVLPLYISILNYLNKNINKYAWFFPLVFSVLLRIALWRTLNLPFYSEASMLPPHYDYWFRFYTMCHLDGFAVGAIISTIKAPTRYKQSSLWFFIMIILLISSSLSYIFKYGPADFRLVLQPLVLSSLFGLAIYFARSIDRIYLDINKKIIYTIALYSYGAYLWNSLFIRFIQRYCADVNWIFRVLLFLILTFTISFISYRFVEMPFLKIRKRFI